MLTMRARTFARVGKMLVGKVDPPAAALVMKSNKEMSHNIRFSHRITRKCLLRKSEGYI